MAEWFVGPIMGKIIDACSEYLEQQVGWQTGMKKELESLRENHPKIHAKRTEFSNAGFLESLYKIRKVGERALKIDPNLKSLEEVVQKLDKVSAGVSTFLQLLDSAKLEQQDKQRELFEACETGSLPTNALIGRGEAKEFVMQWLRKPSNEHRTSWHRNISLLSIVGHGGMGKTTLLQHLFEDMLESLKKHQRPRLDALHELQNSLRTEIMSKKFLLVLDDICEEEENRDMSKWEKLLTHMAHGKIGSRILVTTRMDSVAMKIAKVIQKKTVKFTLEGFEEDQCLRLLNLHAFGIENPPDDHKKLSAIAGEMVKKLLGSPLVSKCAFHWVSFSHLKERPWKILEEGILMF
ncbi:Disease resistance protein RGA2 [Dendrobium catenatum]|uniref:Disease resistance protein RGA2 n=1 Tax=Dendrobium catenatum TaxID=906689 RepID=A0A2I0VEE4_9ASPA|nr:Disease resistance protein RGA2 [Dendrobium catenatum]